MKKKAASGIMLTLLLISMLTLAFSIQSVEAVPTTWTVDDDGPADFNTIKEAIDYAGYRDTIVVSEGLYAEGQINVYKSLTILANGSVTVDGLGDFSVFNVGVSSVTISGFHITNGLHSGVLVSGSRAVIQNNRVDNCQGGIVLFSSYFGLIENNTLYDNHQGIELSHSSYNTVKENKLTGHSLAVLLGYSHYNLLEANIIARDRIGFWLQNSAGNSIVENSVSRNDLGIWLFPNSDSNNIFHNNFLENSIHATVSSDSIDIWNDNYPSGGNYWSSYADVDLCNGPNQDILGMDWIWDHPYVIDVNNKDEYPLVKPWPTIPAAVDIDPQTLNLNSKGKWITAYIQLPENYNPEDVDASTILLNGTIQLVLDPKYGFVTNASEYFVDHNNDGILERVVKFNRTDVASWIHDDLGIQYGNVTLTVAGELSDGTSFEGSDTIQVLFPGDVDGDGDVDFYDFIIFAGCYGCTTGTPRYDQMADFNEDGPIDFEDFIILARNYGKTAT